MQKSEPTKFTRLCTCNPCATFIMNMVWFVEWRCGEGSCVNGTALCDGKKERLGTLSVFRPLLLRKGLPPQVFYIISNTLHCT